MKTKTADEWYKKGHLLLIEAKGKTPKSNALDSDEDPFQVSSPEVKKCYQKAIQAFEQCLGLNPSHTSAWKEKASCNNFLGFHEEALHDIEKAITLKDNDFLAWNLKWISLYRLGRLEESDKAWKVMNELGKGDRK